MTKTTAIDTIRKALRLASKASNKHEAEAARKLAYELMEKHNINIEHDDSENYRERVEGVAGMFWREQLLNNIARAHSCKLLRITRGNTYDAVLTGYMSDVETARNLYQSIQTKMVVDCCMRWKRFSAEELDSVARGWDRTGEDYQIWDDLRESLYDVVDTGGEIRGRSPVYTATDRLANARERAKAQLERLDIVEKEIGNKNAFLAWARAYLDTASDEFGKTLVAPKVKPPVIYESAGFVPSARREDSGRDKEIKKITEDAQELAKKFGERLAQRLQRDAVSFGKIFGSTAATILTRPTLKRLTAASSWLAPPPPPSRFNQLDLDDRPAVDVAAAARKIELDIEDDSKKKQTPRRGGRDLDLD